MSMIETTSDNRPVKYETLTDDKSIKESIVPPLTNSASKYEPVFNTVGSLALKTEFIAEVSTEQEQVLSESDGVILEVSESKVKIELSQDVVAFFPKELFIGKSFVRMGAPIKYQIKKGIDGIRYQDFVLRSDEPKSEMHAELEQLLQGIKLKNEP